MTLDFSTFGAARDSEDLLDFNRYFLFGVSDGASEVETFLTARGKRIAGYLDNAKQKHGTDFHGVTVHDPATVTEHLDDQTAIIISSAYQVEIAEQLIDDLGIPAPQVFPFISEMFKNHFGPNALEPYKFEIEGLLARVADDRSREYILNLLRFRWTMDPRLLRRNPCVTGFYHYQPEANGARASIGPYKGDRIIDCGAFNGDTARAFLERLDRDCEIIAIEPVSANYDALTSWISEAKVSDRVTALKLGVGADQSTMRIEVTPRAEDPRASVARCQENAITEEVAIEKLDAIAIDDGSVDYLKVDIEGFEPDALEGARNMLRRDRPDLAIAGYHDAQHLWQLPQLISNLEPSYQFYVGHHPSAPYECEFFCTARHA